ncbi:MAG: histidine phosphatase family protein [Acidobacteria bacterium]|nr:histidine phosphatase family protein [Acidobacteriota bacterium]
MALHLVRHAKAGDSSAWPGDDELRPLTPAGHKQAIVVSRELGGWPVERILSSRYTRCLETVAPTAAAFMVAVETHDALAEEAPIEATWALVEELAGSGTDTVLYSHRNVLSALLDRVHRRGIDVDAVEWTCRKGSIWRLETDERGGLARAVLALPQA